MTGPSLDLDALRRYLDALESGLNLTVQIRSVDGRILDLAIAETRAVLALVEEQRERISTLEEALRVVVNETPVATDAHSVAVGALDGSWPWPGNVIGGFPAENKEPS